MCAVAPAERRRCAGPVLFIETDRLEGSGYSETVLFAAPLRNGRHIGFILNRPTPAKLETLFPEHAPSRKVVDPVYFGGPELAESLFAIARRAPDGGGEDLPLMPGLVLADRLGHGRPRDRDDAERRTLLAGLVVWRPGELDDEIRAGAWEVRPADATTVFHAIPDRSGEISTPVPEDRVDVRARRWSRRPSPQLAGPPPRWPRRRRTRSVTEAGKAPHS